MALTSEHTSDGAG